MLLLMYLALPSKVWSILLANEGTSLPLFRTMSHYWRKGQSITHVPLDEVMPYLLKCPTENKIKEAWVRLDC